ncbi:glutathione S-transferase family protein [Sphingosinicella microcystinivorans]|uniref:Glutathione S-transferase n=1 Tax=Sphingosinicella microcystinivorans TaxID=335406 RepID=A0AAD1G0S0_SPHMI|nr:glutathione S-transferase family protein [Sphingosinicella microcystinivorans]RKS90932.1 glutathione S-transferase [Sphingosinicella microcystinivorans]BBE33851.1 glutathione S-transferase [Sphingosinicella microcystinivorans]
MKLVIGNRRYSSWSLRGWLAAKLADIPFEEVMIPLDTPEFTAAKADASLMPSGTVPVLWDGNVAVWESLAIIDWLADRVGRDVFWPKDNAARALARSIAAEMHAGFANLRRHCPMNTGRTYPSFPLTQEVERDIGRIDALWREALHGFGGEGGPFLFGAFGAADIMYAPVVTRFRTYDVLLSDTSAAYVNAVLAHPLMQDWYAGADAEDWRLDRIEY